MKFFVQKNNIKWSISLIELIITGILSTFIIFISMSLIIDFNDNLTSLNIKSKSFSNILDFRDKFEWYLKSWYIYDSGSIITRDTNNLIILKNTIKSEYVVFWLVDLDILRFQSGYILWNNYLWYRKLSQLEYDSIVIDNSYIDSLNIFKDNIFDKTIIKDFKLTLYNTWSLINVDISVINLINKEDFWKNFNDIKIDSKLFQYFNLIF